MAVEKEAAQANIQKILCKRWGIKILDILKFLKLKLFPFYIATLCKDCAKKMNLFSGIKQYEKILRTERHPKTSLIKEPTGFKKNGGAKEDRTPDLYSATVALSQLSYGPTFRCLTIRKKLTFGKENFPDILKE